MMWGGKKILFCFKAAVYIVQVWFQSDMLLMFRLQISPYIATSVHLYHQRHLCLSSRLQTGYATLMPIFGLPKGAIMPVCYHICEGKMWPNSLQYRQGRSGPCCREEEDFQKKSLQRLKENEWMKISMMFTLEGINRTLNVSEKQPDRAWAGKVICPVFKKKEKEKKGYLLCVAALILASQHHLPCTDSMVTRLPLLNTLLALFFLLSRDVDNTASKSNTCKKHICTTANYI